MKEIVAFDLEELHSLMKEQGLDNLNQVSNSAYRNVDNHGGEFILPNSTGEAVFYQEIYGSLTSKIELYEIQYSFGGQAVFTPGSLANTRYLSNYLLRR